MAAKPNFLQKLNALPAEKKALFTNIVPTAAALKARRAAAKVRREALDALIAGGN